MFEFQDTIFLGMHDLSLLFMAIFQGKEEII